jgi:hypothetical protein
MVPTLCGQFLEPRTYWLVQEAVWAAGLAWTVKLYEKEAARRCSTIPSSWAGSNHSGRHKPIISGEAGKPHRPPAPLVGEVVWASITICKRGGWEGSLTVDTLAS